MTTGAIVLFILAIIIAILGITLAIHTGTAAYLSFLCFAFPFCIIGLILQCSTPTDADVKKGTAHYVEQNHIEIVNGDTINNYKTYKIEWIENFK